MISTFSAFLSSAASAIASATRHDPVGSAAFAALAFAGVVRALAAGARDAPPLVRLPPPSFFPFFTRVDATRSPSPPASAADLSLSVRDPLLRAELLEPHRAVRVELRRRDAHLGAEPELAAVVEPRRRVHEH